MDRIFKILEIAMLVVIAVGIIVLIAMSLTSEPTHYYQNGIECDYVHGFDY